MTYFSLTQENCYIIKTLICERTYRASKTEKSNQILLKGNEYLLMFW